MVRRSEALKILGATNRKLPSAKCQVWSNPEQFVVGLSPDAAGQAGQLVQRHPGPRVVGDVVGDPCRPQQCPQLQSLPLGVEEQALD
ncbi:MAG: hypothetical protein KAZ88_10840 [Acidimicrobiia bacterium]|nr:hypothetical protein [Acidimicrobiia bacterium]